MTAFSSQANVNCIQTQWWQSYLEIVFISIILLSIRYLIIKFSRWYNGLPIYGPVGLPFVGCMWNKFKVFYINDEDNLMSYGANCDVFTTRCGTTDIVIFNDIDLIKEIRSNNRDTFDIMMQNWSGLHWGDVQSFMFSNLNWKKRRKLVHKTLITQHQSGFVDQMFKKYFKSLVLPKLFNDKNWNTIQDDLAEALFLITAQLTFDTEQDDNNNNNDNYKIIRESALKIIDIYGDAFDYSHLFYPFTFIPILLYGTKVYHTNNNKGLFTIWNKNIKPILMNKLLKTKQNKLCMDSNKYKNKTYFDFAINEGILSDDEIISDAYGIIEGKVTSSALRCSWGIYLFALYPEIYNNIKQELFDVFPNKIFSFKKINQCVMLKSFVYEVVRTGSFYRLSFGRMVTNKNGINFKTRNGSKYHLPKGTIIKINKCYTDYSNKYFKYPKTIYLKHHIDSNGKFKLHPYFTSFGIGMRNCVGQTIAIKEMSILFATLILMRFKFELTPNDKHKHLLKITDPLKRKLSVFTYKDAQNAAVIVKTY